MRSVVATAKATARATAALQLLGKKAAQRKPLHTIALARLRLAIAFPQSRATHSASESRKFVVVFVVHCVFVHAVWWQADLVEKCAVVVCRKSGSGKR